MGHPERLRVVVIHNRDFDLSDVCDLAVASRADVENAARDVSGALRSRGHEVALEVVAGQGGARAESLGRVVDRIAARRPDLVFNLCESLGGDSRHEIVLPALLDLAGLPYTGSGPLALGLALRKDRCKHLLRVHGVPTPPGITIARVGELLAPELTTLGYPLIVKPTREDASVGIDRFSVVHDGAQLRKKVVDLLERFRQPILVERFIPGREIYVSLLGNDPVAPVGMHEIDFSTLPRDLPRIVSYRGKWQTASAEYRGTRPVRAEGLSHAERAALESAACAAFAALGLCDYARVDIRLAEDGTPYVIDVNPNCDLSDGAGVSRAAGFSGVGYAELIERICHTALARARREREEHVHRVAPRSRPAPAAASAHAAPRAAERSGGARDAAPGGRPVHVRGALGRARVDRRRAR
jgi:D-alanine-D-alanine ligase